MVGKTWETLAMGDVIGKEMYWIHVPVKSW